MDLDEPGFSAGAAPRISVCVLNHNYACFLRQAIDSCLAQEPGAYRLEEILILDDGSTDHSLRVCAEFGDRIKVLSRSHGGFPVALTAGIESCQGEWVALLDADDWFAPDKLRTVSRHLRQDRLLVQHWEHVVDESGHPLTPQPHPGGNTSTLIVRRADAVSLLPVSNERFFHTFDDLGRGIRLTAPLTYYRVHSRSMTDRVRPGAHQEYMAGVCEEIAIRLTQLRAAPPHWASAGALRRLSWHYQAEAHAHQVEAALQLGRRSHAWRLVRRELVLTALASRAWRRRAVSIRSVLTGTPCLQRPPHRERETR